MILKYFRNISKYCIFHFNTANKTYKLVVVVYASIEVDGLNQCLVTGSEGSLCANSIRDGGSGVEGSNCAEGEGEDGTGELHDIFANLLDNKVLGEEGRSSLKRFWRLAANLSDFRFDLLSSKKIK
jgi:hypothetical protein